MAVILSSDSVGIVHKALARESPISLVWGNWKGRHFRRRKDENPVRTSWQCRHSMITMSSSSTATFHPVSSLPPPAHTMASKIPASTTGIELQHTQEPLRLESVHSIPDAPLNASPEDIPPTRGYQALLLFSGFMMIFHIIGINGTFGIFQVTLSTCVFLYH
jgi:hypothetical protein